MATNQNALMQMVKAKRLDRDPRAQLEITSARANAYFQVLVERATDKSEPTEAQLRALYDELAAQAKAGNNPAGVPPFDQVKGQLPDAWKRKQTQVARDAALARLNQKIQVTFAPDYQPAGN
ncbi:MAG: hypothetical protein ABSH53_22585 [Holophaga sp.]